MNKTLWILTTEFNDFDQYGAYIVTAYTQKPLKSDLLITLFGGDGQNENYKPKQHILINHILTGGGRIKHEDQWYNLKEIIAGQVYQNFGS